MDIFAYLWTLYGQVVTEIFAFAAFEIAAYFALIRCLEGPRVIKT